MRLCAFVCLATYVTCSWGAAHGAVVFFFDDKSGWEAAATGGVEDFLITSLNVALADEVAVAPNDAPSTRTDYGQFLTFDSSNTGLSTSFVVRNDTNPVSSNVAYLSGPPGALGIRSNTGTHDFSVLFGPGDPIFIGEVTLASASSTTDDLIIFDGSGNELGSTEFTTTSEICIGFVSDTPIGRVTIDDADASGGRVLRELRFGFELTCMWDLDGDGNVGAADLATLIGTWGLMGVDADFFGDGVGADDLAELLGRWGPCP